MDAQDLDALRTRDYWEKRYNNEPPGHEFDWFKCYDDLAPWLNEIIHFEDTILMLGCGNSGLSSELYKRGFTNIQNIDFSEAVIKKMSSKYSHMPKMTWKVMDVRDLKIESSSIDVAIDKGTMDALLCSSGSVWSPSEEIKNDCKMEVDEVIRVLKPGGRFFYVSFGQPHFRVPHLDRTCWKGGVKTTVLGDGGIVQYFIYEMQKKPYSSCSPRRC